MGEMISGKTWDGRQSGVQMLPLKVYLEKILKEDPSRLFVWRSLINPNYPPEEFWELNPQFANWLLALADQEIETCRQINSLATILTSKGTADVSAELVAVALKNMNVLRRTKHGGKHSRSYVPRDFSSDQRANGKDIKLLGGCRFCTEVKLVL